MIGYVLYIIDGKNKTYIGKNRIRLRSFTYPSLIIDTDSRLQNAKVFDNEREFNLYIEFLSQHNNLKNYLKFEKVEIEDITIKRIKGVKYDD